jgi:hypothetical protein
LCYTFNMDTEVLLETLPNHRYRATGTDRFTVSAEGATCAEAIQNFRVAAARSITGEAEVVSVDIPIRGAHAWSPFAGVFADEPLFDAWQEIIAENRRAEDDSDAL